MLSLLEKKSAKKCKTRVILFKFNVRLKIKSQLLSLTYLEFCLESHINDSQIYTNLQLTFLD